MLHAFSHPQLGIVAQLDTDHMTLDIRYPWGRTARRTYRTPAPLLSYADEIGLLCMVLVEYAAYMDDENAMKRATDCAQEVIDWAERVVNHESKA